MCWSIIFFLGYLLSVFKFSDENMYQRIPLSIFVLILLIFVTYSTVSLSIRRYHDLGKSGWNVLWYFVPLANIIFCLSLLFVSGDEKENQYGAPPDNSKSFLADIFNL